MHILVPGLGGGGRGVRCTYTCARLAGRWQGGEVHILVPGLGGGGREVRCTYSCQASEGE